VIERSLGWEEIEGSDRLEFKAKGTGEVSVAVGMEFIPSQIQQFPSYRGILVQRKITLDEGDTGSLSRVPQGSVVFVTISVMTPDALAQTQISCLMPGGLEPLDPNITGEEDSCPVPYFRYFGSFLQSCPTQITEPTKVEYTYDRLPPGTQTVRFRAVAVSVGRFMLPPAKAFSVEYPEVMGLSSGGIFEICKGNLCVPELEESVEPQNCPDNCNGNGTCNIATGKCICFEGFSGKSCDETSA